MQIIGDNAGMIEFLRKNSESDIIIFNFSSEWGSGKAELFSDRKNFKKFGLEVQKIATGKKKMSWLSEEGDLELKMNVGSTGKIVVSIVCCPSMNLQYPGRIEFEFETSLSAIDRAIAEA